MGSIGREFRSSDIVSLQPILRDGCEAMVRRAIS